MELCGKSAGVLGAVPVLAFSSGSVAVGDKMGAEMPKKKSLDEFADVMRRRHLS